MGDLGREKGRRDGVRGRGMRYHSDVSAYFFFWTRLAVEFVVLFFIIFSLIQT